MVWSPCHSPAQVLYCSATGRPRPWPPRTALRVNPHVDIEPMTRLTSYNAAGSSPLRPVLVTDDDSPALRRHAACYATGMPLVSGATGLWTARSGLASGLTAASDGESDPCYRCLVRDTPQCETCASSAFSAPGLRDRVVMAVEAVKLITGAGEPEGRCDSTPERGLAHGIAQADPECPSRSPIISGVGVLFPSPLRGRESMPSMASSMSTSQRGWRDSFADGGSTQLPASWRRPGPSDAFGTESLPYSAPIVLPGRRQADLMLRDWGEMSHSRRGRQRTVSAGRLAHRQRVSWRSRGWIRPCGRCGTAAARPPRRRGRTLTRRRPGATVAASRVGGGPAAPGQSRRAPVGAGQPSRARQAAGHLAGEAGPESTAVGRPACLASTRSSASASPARRPGEAHGQAVAACARGRPASSAVLRRVTASKGASSCPHSRWR